MNDQQFNIVMQALLDIRVLLERLPPAPKVVDYQRAHELTARAEPAASDDLRKIKGYGPDWDRPFALLAAGQDPYSGVLGDSKEDMSRRGQRSAALLRMEKAGLVTSRVVSEDGPNFRRKAWALAGQEPAQALIEPEATPTTQPAAPIAPAADHYQLLGVHEHLCRRMVEVRAWLLEEAKQNDDLHDEATIATGFMSELDAAMVMLQNGMTPDARRRLIELHDQASDFVKKHSLTY